MSNYDDAPELENPTHDARAVAAEFWRSGFEVVELIDPEIDQLNATLQTVSDRLQPTNAIRDVLEVPPEGEFCIDYLQR